MLKKWLREHLILLCITLGFLIIISVTVFTFVKMDQKIDKENEKLLQEVSSMYISNIAQQTISHEETYFENRFELVDRILTNAIDNSSKALTVQELQNELSEGVNYASLINSDGTLEAFRGDSTVKIIDSESFAETLKTGNNKVFLTSNSKEETSLGMVLPRNFELDGKEYKGIVCGFPLETLNTVFNLSYGDANLTYSFVIRKKDSGFVIRNEGAFRTTYFERVRAIYQDYNGMTAEDYVTHFTEAMEKNEVYSDSFMMEGGVRMFYATPLKYADWYLLTFVRYDEINSLLGDNNKRSDLIFTRYTGLLVAVSFAVFACYAILSYRQIQKTKRSESKAISASKAKSDFLANMSHDIRTPMNAIVGMTEIARSHLDDTARVEDCLNKISLSGRHMIYLINDVLDMSKIENGKMTLSVAPTTLREILESIVMIIQPQVKNKNHKFDIFVQDIISESVYCDSLRLNQILINLASNAVKYTPENGKISITVNQEQSPKGDEYVRTHFKVTDNGIGMSEDFIKIVFESFEREDRKRTTKEEGTGLGLAITKYLVDAMGGTIEVTSKLNVGSEFHVIIDFKKSHADGHDMTLDGLNVLVIDDNEDQCIATTETLRELGTKTDYLLDGESAIKRIEASPDEFDVILIDWQMPNIDGVETSKEIRKHTGHETPIILISAYDCSDLGSSIDDAGINGFLLKPLFKSTLYHGIKENLNQTEKKQEEKPSGTTFMNERILLAEDNELNGEIAVEMLTSAGLSVDWVTDGKQCLEKFNDSEQGYYKAIVMDIRMPIMNGYEAATAIRALDRPDSDIPIIAATADAFAEDVAKAKECGMNDHIAKPIDIKMLLNLLAKYR